MVKSRVCEMRGGKRSWSWTLFFSGSKLLPFPQTTPSTLGTLFLQLHFVPIGTYAGTNQLFSPVNPEARSRPSLTSWLLDFLGN